MRGMKWGAERQKPRQRRPHEISSPRSRFPAANAKFIKIGENFGKGGDDRPIRTQKRTNPSSPSNYFGMSTETDWVLQKRFALTTCNY